MKIDVDFVKGVSYYIGDGRMSAPRSLSTVNQDIKVIRFFIKWLKCYFNIKAKNIKIFIKLNKKNFNKSKIIEYYSKQLRLNSKRINSVFLKSGAKKHHKVLIEVIANNKTAKKYFDNIIPKVKLKCLNNKKLAIAYLRGIMAAEGSPKFHIKSGSRAVHLKMKNEKEIKYIGILLNNLLKVKTSVLKSKSENGMWLVAISGVDELKKLNNFDIFEIESRKRIRLKIIINSYKRSQVKKGYVDIFYLSKLSLFNSKYKRPISPPEFAKLIGRDRTRISFVLRNLQRKGLVNGVRKLTRGKPYVFSITERGNKLINNFS
jgi:DNA-binding MarR family transcriptional regulator